MNLFTPLNGLPFTNGNAKAGIQPSIIPAQYFVAIQEEIVNVINTAGLSPISDNYEQLAVAIDTLIDNKIDSFHTTVLQPIFSTFETTISQLRNDVDNHTTELNSHATSIQSLTDITTNHTADLSNLNNIANNVVPRLAAVESNLQTHDDRLTQLDNGLNDANVNINTLTNRCDTADEMINSHSELLNDHSTNLDNLNNSTIELSNITAEHTSQITNIFSELNNINDVLNNEHYSLLVAIVTAPIIETPTYGDIVDYLTDDLVIKVKPEWELEDIDPLIGVMYSICHIDTEYNLIEDYSTTQFKYPQIEEPDEEENVTPPNGSDSDGDNENDEDGNISTVSEETDEDIYPVENDEEVNTEEPIVLTIEEMCTCTISKETLEEILTDSPYTDYFITVTMLGSTSKSESRYTMTTLINSENQGFKNEVLEAFKSDIGLAVENENLVYTPVENTTMEIDDKGVLYMDSTHLRYQKITFQTNEEGELEALL